MVVDDNSPDGTALVVEELQRQYSSLLLLRRKEKDGLGRAYAAGFKKVLEAGDFSVVAMMDADLSHNPKYLPAMLSLADSYDLVIGSRYINGGGITKNWGWARKILSAGGNLYLKILFRRSVKDWTTGYNVIRTNVLRRIDLDSLFPRGYAFLSSLKYYLIEAGANFREYPIFFEERNGGESKMHFGIIYEGVIAPWKMIWR